MPLPVAPLLILLGLRGSGKSTAGKLAAFAMTPPALFLDLDLLIAADAGEPSVAALWEREGESGFRRREGAKLRELVDPGKPPRVPTLLALGGGTPMAPGAADLLLAVRDEHRGLLVYLHARPGVLRERLRRTDMSSRPALLRGSGPGAAQGRGDALAEIDAVYEARDAHYRRLASVTIEAEAEPGAVATALVRAWTAAPPAEDGARRA